LLISKSKKYKKVKYKGQVNFVFVFLKYPNEKVFVLKNVFCFFK